MDRQDGIQIYFFQEKLNLKKITQHQDINRKHRGKVRRDLGIRNGGQISEVNI